VMVRSIDSIFLLTSQVSDVSLVQDAAAIGPVKVMMNLYVNPTEILHRR